PGPPKIDQDFDFEQLPRYKADVQLYMNSVDGSIAASLAAAGVLPACGTESGSGTPAKLSFCTESGRAIVQVQDGSGKLVASASNAIVISASPAGNMVVTANASNGAASFDQMQVAVPGTYLLTATSSNLTSGASGAFHAAINADRAREIRNRIINNFMG